MNRSSFIGALAFLALLREWWRQRQRDRAMRKVFRRRVQKGW